VVAAVVLVALIAVGALRVSAVHAYGRSLNASLPLAQRAAAADLAARLDPLDRSFATHRFVFDSWLRGRQLLDAGDYNGAVAILGPACLLDESNTQLIALYKRASLVQSLESIRKAHLQHGHEGPGGTLRPQDVER